jgi:Amt family ammonium transporter
MKATFGIRTEPAVEAAGLDVSEHGMWGYPELYIPVPGGYGTEVAHHGHAVKPRAVVAANGEAQPVPEPA